MNADIKKVAEDLKSLNISQIADLLKHLSNDLDVDLEKLLSASASDNSENEQSAEQQEGVKKKFVLKLVGFDKTKQMNIIRAIKTLKPDLSLLEAKNQLNTLPFVLKGDLLEGEVNALKIEWETIGGQMQVADDK